MNQEEIKTQASLWSGFGLALTGTTCCALPAVLVTAGMGGTVASLVSAMPWLVWLSRYKAVTFSVTALVLLYSWWRLTKLKREGSCTLSSKRWLRWQKRLLWVNSTIFVVALFAAYALLPLMRWLESA